MGRVAARFARVEPRRRTRAFVTGLLAGLPRTNCWTIAEHAGDTSPDRMQHLLARAVWDADAVRDDLRGYVIEHLGDPDAVLVVDETGDLKKGTATVGVQRQYTGTAGRIENAQVAVYLTYASREGVRVHRPGAVSAAVVDRRPGPVRRRGRSGRRRVRDQTSPGHGDDRPRAGRRHTGTVGGRRRGLRRRPRAASRTRSAAESATSWPSPETIRSPPGSAPAGPTSLAARLPKRAWQRLSAGKGAKGERFYDWALIDTADAAADPDGTGRHWLLVRRNRRTGELAYHRAYCPTPVRLATLVAWPDPLDASRSRSSPARN